MRLGTMRRACRRLTPRIPCSVGQVPCSGKKSSLFPEEQGTGCKPLNPLGDRLQKPPRETGIERDFQKFPADFPAFREWGGPM